MRRQKGVAWFDRRVHRETLSGGESLARRTPRARRSALAMKKVLKHLLWIIPAIIVILVISLASYAAIARSADRDYHSKLQKTIQVSSKSFQNEQEMAVAFLFIKTSRSLSERWKYELDKS